MTKLFGYPIYLPKLYTYSQDKSSKAWGNEVAKAFLVDTDSQDFLPWDKGVDTTNWAVFCHKLSHATRSVQSIS